MSKDSHGIVNVTIDYMIIDVSLSLSLFISLSLYLFVNVSACLSLPLSVSISVYGSVSVYPCVHSLCACAHNHLCKTSDD